MLSQAQRTTILELHGQGVGKREIARVLNVSRLTVRKVLRSNSVQVPRLSRPEKAEPYRQQILELWQRCRGNLVRVQEELAASGASFSYQTLTAFCRRHGIGQPPAVAAGVYEFQPGEELQHDTSPHEVLLAGKKRRVQTASAVLCYSRMLFFQMYPTFQRFDCKVFLTEALRYFGGAPTQQVMIDNTHVVVLRGTGRQMVPVPEMAAFAERFGFHFRAHELGDANRSGRVERPFHFVEHNFLAGRSFANWTDLNQQARQWCDRVNATYKKHIRAIPRELFVLEQRYLRPLPVWVPEVYRLHERMVDVEGYVALHSNRYSVPLTWIGRRVEVRETRDKIELQLDARNLVTHQRVPEAEHQRVLLPQHRPPRGQGVWRPHPHPEEALILEAAPEIADYLAALKQHSRKLVVLVLRQLLRFVREYPREPLLAAVQEAARYGLYDLDRVERMILRRVAHDYFLLDPSSGGNHNNEDQ
jgi:transposase